jgi:hypothetical protein
MNKRIYELSGLKVKNGIRASMGGGGDAPDPPEVEEIQEAVLSAQGRMVQKKLQGQAARLGRGKWYKQQDRDFRKMFASMREQHRSAEFDLENQLGRLQTDSKIDQFATASNEQFEAKDAELPFREDMWAGDVRAAGNAFQTYNNAAIQRAQQAEQYGTFASNLAGGLGEGAGFIASTEYAKRFQGQTA